MKDTSWIKSCIFWWPSADRTNHRHLHFLTFFKKFSATESLNKPQSALLLYSRSFLKSLNCCRRFLPPLSQLLLFCWFDRLLRRPIERLAFAGFPLPFYWHRLSFVCLLLFESERQTNAPCSVFWRRKEPSASRLPPLPQLLLFCFFDRLLRVASILLCFLTKEGTVGVMATPLVAASSFLLLRSIFTQTDWTTCFC